MTDRDPSLGWKECGMSREDVCKLEARADRAEAEVLDLLRTNGITNGLAATLTQQLASAQSRAENAEKERDARFPADEYYTNLNDALSQRDAAIARAEAALAISDHNEQLWRKRTDAAIARIRELEAALGGLRDCLTLTKDAFRLADEGRPIPMRWLREKIDSALRSDGGGEGKT